MSPNAPSTLEPLYIPLTFYMSLNVIPTLHLSLLIFLIILTIIAQCIQVCFLLGQRILDGPSRFKRESASINGGGTAAPILSSMVSLR